MNCDNPVHAFLLSLLGLPETLFVLVMSAAPQSQIPREPCAYLAIPSIIVHCASCSFACVHNLPRGDVCRMCCGEHRGRTASHTVLHSESHSIATQCDVDLVLRHHMLTILCHKCVRDSTFTCLHWVIIIIPRRSLTSRFICRSPGQSGTAQQRLADVHGPSLRQPGGTRAGPPAPF